MQYTLRATRLIHWDDEDFFRKEYDPSAVIRLEIAVNVFKAKDNILPTEIEDKISILKKDIQLFSCIFCTKSILRFDKDENPVNDLDKMFNEVFLQEQAKWKEITIGTIFYHMQLDMVDYRPETRFNKIYQIMEIARQQKILK
jgi:hypothetical protein